MHPTVGDGVQAGQCLSFPPWQQQHRCPTTAPQHGAAWAGSPGARWSSATAQRHGGGWLWGGRSPFQPRAQTENKLHSRYKEQPPKHPRDSGELGTGGQGQRALLRPLLGIWGTGLGVLLGAGSGEAEARVGPALFQQKNLQCVRGAGSVTTAMPRGPGASPCHPCRAGGGRRGAQGAAGAPRAWGARVGLWPGLLVTDLPREGKDGEARQLRAFSRLPRRWQDRGLVPEEPEVPEPTRGEDAALEPTAAVPAPALLGAAVPGERHAHHGDHAGHRWVSVELGGGLGSCKTPRHRKPHGPAGGMPVLCAPGTHGAGLVGGSPHGAPGAAQPRGIPGHHAARLGMGLVLGNGARLPQGKSCRAVSQGTFPVPCQDAPGRCSRRWGRVLGGIPTAPWGVRPPPGPEQPRQREQGRRSRRMWQGHDAGGKRWELAHAPAPRTSPEMPQGT